MAILPIEVKTTGINQVDQLNRKLGGLERQSKKAQSSTSKLSSTVSNLAGAAVAYIAIDRLATSVINLGKSFVTTADSMSLINSRLSLVTASSQELALVQTQLLNISNQARVGISGTSDLYAQLARSTQSLGFESRELLDVTRTISQTLTISGASAQSANAALFQLSQGLSAGALRGEELNSVLEQTPRLAQAIADGMGVSIGQLRQLGSEGALTAEKVLQALQTQAQAVNSEFAGIAVTAQSGYTTLQNNITATVGKLDEQHKITQTIGKSYVALGEVVDTLLITAFEELTGESKDFGELTVGVIGGVIGAGGALYDTFESVGDVFSVIGSAGESAFYGIQVVSSTVSRSIQENFQSVLNGIIDGYNSIASYVGLPTLGRLDFGVEQLRAREDYAKTQFEQASARLSENAQDLANVSTVGRDTADKMIQSFSTKFAELMSQETDNVERETRDYASALEKFEEDITDTATTVTDLTESNDELKTTIADLLKETENTVSEFDDLVEVTDDLNNTYTVTTTKTNDLADSSGDLNDTIDTTIDKIEVLTASFTDTFIRSLENNINSLNNLANDTTFNTVSYSKALQQAQEARNNLLSNPLDVEIGEQYKTAYDTFTRSASSFIQDTSRFSSREAQMFAQSTFRTQSGQLQATATEAATVLDGIRELTELINTSFEDGILTDEEKTTIASVADSVNIKNESLLGTNGQLAGVINGQVYFDNSDVVDTIGSQTYYDNTGLYTGGNITIDNTGFNQTNFTDNGLTSTQLSNAGLMKDSTFTDNGLTNSDFEKAGLMKDSSFVAPYKNILVDNQISDYAKDSTLIRGISVTDSQIADLTSLNESQRDALLQANSDSLLTISELQNISGLSSDNISQLVNVGSVLSSDINGQTYFDNSLLAKDATLGILDNTISQSGLSTIQAINEQEYYNNKETIDAINGQTYFDNGSIVSAVSGIVLDNTDVIGAINSQKYYDNTDIVGAVGGINLDTSPIVTALDTLELSGGEVNIDTSSIVNATNSVTSAVNEMAGAKSISDLVSVSDTIAGYTGLTKNDIVAVKGNTQASTERLDTMTDGNSFGLKNLKVKQQLTVTKYEGQGWVYSTIDGDRVYTGTYGTPTGDLITGQATSYTYYAKGGFTGNGYGTPDHTGYKPAGIVHENEWVAPKWMINQNPSLFRGLENVRQNGSFAQGGYTGAKTVQSSSGNSDKLLMSLLMKMDSIDNTLKRVTQSGESMNVVLQG